MVQLKTYKFSNDILEVVENSNKWVGIKAICINIGIDFKFQHQKLKSDPTYEAKLLKVQTAGGVQEVFCIPLDKLNGWLFSINPNRTKPEVREKLILYKKECFRILYEHFNHKNHKDDELKIGLGQYRALESKTTKLEKKYYEQLELTNKLLLEKLAQKDVKNISRKRWEREELEKLESLYSAGASHFEIAKALGRSKQAIETKIRRYVRGLR